MCSLKCKFIIMYLISITFNNKSNSIYIDVYVIKMSDKNNNIQKSSRHLHVVTK